MADITIGGAAMSFMPERESVVIPSIRPRLGMDDGFRGPVPAIAVPEEGNLDPLAMVQFLRCAARFGAERRDHRDL